MGVDLGDRGGGEYFGRTLGVESLVIIYLMKNIYFSKTKIGKNFVNKRIDPRRGK